MQFPWQETVVLTLVAIAAGYLCYRAAMIAFRKRAGGCGTCSSCPSEGENQPSDEKQIVSLTSDIRPNGAARTPRRQGAKM